MVYYWKRECLNFFNDFVTPKFLLAFIDRLKFPVVSKLREGRGGGKVKRKGWVTEAVKTGGGGTMRGEGGGLEVLSISQFPENI